MSTTNEEPPPRVTPEKEPTQGGVRSARWAWVARSAWSERMLEALEKGVKGNVWFSLIDKVYSEKNLREAATKVIANGGASGVDHVNVKQFERDLDANVRRLAEELRTEKYRPRDV